MKFSAPRGTKDILPHEAKICHELERRARHIFANFNYNEIRTPIFEDVGLFNRSLGQNTDIVEKQLLRLKSEGKNEFVLRPEATASIVRAFIEHDIPVKETFSKYFYIGPMFRGERPQKGRLREFFHIGAEAIGISNPYLDSEVISLAINLMKGFGIEEYKLKINNLGCKKDKEKWSKLLRAALKDKIEDFCGLCKKRFDRNVFRILDCKNKNCKETLKNLELAENHICSDCADYFKRVLINLKTLGIAYELSPFLVRGLDYYTGTVFEITHRALGSQDALGAGGRYDNLMSQLGGPDLGATGFALGLERIILALKKKPDTPDAIDAYLIALDKQVYQPAFLLLDKLRKEKISSDINYYERASLKSQMRSANKAGAKFVIIIGDEEIKTGSVSLKDMSTGKQEKIKSEQIIKELKKRL
ncbi:MAG: histidine--tRNA ligase [Candidatus Omnitrophota bacterium]